MQRVVAWSVCGVALAALAGCKSHMDPKAMAEMMKQPARPIELDRLNAFVGSWSGTAQGNVMGQEFKDSKGRHSFRWDADRWVLVENWEHEMGPDQTMKGINLMWWDAGSNCYRMSSASNFGDHSRGTSTYDEATGTWHMKADSWDRDGRKSCGKGTMKLTDARSMEWSWTETDSLGLTTYMTITGTSQRQ